MSREVHRDPLVSRYSSRGMQELFSEQTKFRAWRRCWIALAEAQRELGLGDIVTEEALAQMRATADDVDFAAAERWEREIRHDVMAHVRAWGEQCPAAAGIIHLGATSQFVGCNTDLLLHARALGMVRGDLARAASALAGFVEEHRALPVLGATHFQPAQPTTLGKRFAVALQDLLLDLDSVEWAAGLVRARGAKGATGTQASFLRLFGGDREKVRRLDRLVAEKLGFEEAFPITGQTYPRKVDTKIAEALAGIGATAHWIGTNVRLMAGLEELEEPFGDRQVGSSAMAYKRNPMRSERMCSLARKLMGLPADFHHTHAVQWLERSLDDSALRRIDIPQMYLLADAVLGLLADVCSGLRPNEAAIRRRLDAELPFLATEEILMAAVERGADRQAVHEAIREQAVAVALAIRDEGAGNDLLDRLAGDDRVPLGAEEIRAVAGDPARFVGLAADQVEDFLSSVVRPRLASFGEARPSDVGDRVRV